MELARNLDDLVPERVSFSTSSSRSVSRSGGQTGAPGSVRIWAPSCGLRYGCPVAATRTAATSSESAWSLSTNASAPARHAARASRGSALHRQGHDRASRRGLEDRWNRREARPAGDAEVEHEHGWLVRAGTCTASRRRRRPRRRPKPIPQPRAASAGRYAQPHGRRRAQSSYRAVIAWALAHGGHACVWSG
jgi:hypothetical protein